MFSAHSRQSNNVTKKSHARWRWECCRQNKSLAPKKGLFSFFKQDKWKKKKRKRKKRKLTFVIDSGWLEALGALKLNPSESSRINGDASIPFAFELDRFVLANNFAAEFQRPAFVGHFDEFWRLAWTRWRRRNDDSRIFVGGWRRGEFAVAFLHASLDHRLQERVLSQHIDSRRNEFHQKTS